MKRAAGQIRKARRNKSDKDAGSFDVGNDYHNDQVHQPMRRKPTAEEAALTAKNYRLAKELVSLVSTHCLIMNLYDQKAYVHCFQTPQSDLRVRHREENKNVSRLTTENVSPPLHVLF